MVEAAQKLLDFSQPIDVPLLEQTVELMYGAANGEQVEHYRFALIFACSPGVLF